MNCTRCGDALDTAAKCAGVDTCAGCALEAGELECTTMIPVLPLSQAALAAMRDPAPVQPPPAPPVRLRPVAPERELSRRARGADAGEMSGEDAA